MVARANQISFRFEPAEPEVDGPGKGWPRYSVTLIHSGTEPADNYTAKEVAFLSRNEHGDFWLKIRPTMTVEMIECLCACVRHDFPESGTRRIRNEP